MYAKLGEKGGEQVTPVLFIDVPKVEVEISHHRLTSIAHDFDVSNDCGTGKRQSASVIFSRSSTNQIIVLPEPATYITSCQMMLGRNGNGTHVSHGSREATQLISNPGKCCPERTMLLFPHDEHCTQYYNS